MNKVQLPHAATPSPSTGATQTTQPSSLESYPPALSKRPVQEQISGIIQGQNKNGQLLVQTMLGELAVNTQVKLPPGTEVLIQFRTQRPPFEVLLVPQHNNKTKLQPSNVPPTDKLSLGHILQATFLNKSTLQAKNPLPNEILNLQPGKIFQAKIELIPASIQQGTTVKSSVNPQIGPQVIQTTSISPTQTLPSTISNTQSSTPPLPNPNTVRATVIGNTNGQPIVQTSLGNIQLSLKASLPAGTQLSLMFLPHMDDPALSSGDRTLPGNYQTLSGSGQDLRSVLQSALSALIQQGQGNLLAKHLPHQGPALTSGILLFLNAIKAGGNRPWVGQDAISLLRSSGNIDLAQQLTNDNPALNRPLETPQGDWRMTQLPILHEGTLQKATLFVRDRESGAHKEGKFDQEEATRFKLEVEMSRDGDMQFDGLVKKNMFDLVIRSRNELPNQMQSKISEMFYGANGATGFSGRLTFEASQEWEKLTDIANKLIAGSHNSTLA
ncbi:hypothetical protein [Kiloniella antarctica]|uniref:Flagellar hook-length control protein-like C-terminal domain-containing protein n=1 Tax=Kiloniella antarctica TaxID=1550907 RepID=A0ABW5BT37_9PROT